VKVTLCERTPRLKKKPFFRSEDTAPQSHVYFNNFIKFFAFCDDVTR